MDEVCAKIVDKLTQDEESVETSDIETDARPLLPPATQLLTTRRLRPCLVPIIKPLSAPLVAVT